MRVQDIMETTVDTVPETVSAETAWSQMQMHGIRHLVVTRGSDVVGVVSTRDLGGPAGTALRRTHVVADLMTKSVVSADPTLSIREAANLLRVDRLAAYRSWRTARSSASSRPATCSSCWARGSSVLTSPSDGPPWPGAGRVVNPTFSAETADDGCGERRLDEDGRTGSSIVKPGQVQQRSWFEELVWSPQQSKSFCVGRA
jgi:hypothetical protein